MSPPMGTRTWIPYAQGDFWSAEIFFGLTEKINQHDWRSFPSTDLPKGNYIVISFLSEINLHISSVSFRFHFLYPSLLVILTKQQILHFTIM